ncbi:MAG: hypothetical protein HUU29_13200 [Planctomycetaceae bacterium]|nr:hypothetical protein [Planctomycetaceae bacterium]
MGLWGKLGFYDPDHVPKNPNKLYRDCWLEPVNYNARDVNDRPMSLDAALSGFPAVLADSIRNDPVLIEALRNDPDLAARTEFAIKDICLRTGLLAGALSGAKVCQIMRDEMNKRR